jgi:hypothetical protein
MFVSGLTSEPAEQLLFSFPWLQGRHSCRNCKMVLFFDQERRLNVGQRFMARRQKKSLKVGIDLGPQFTVTLTSPVSKTITSCYASIRDTSTSKLPFNSPRSISARARRPKHRQRDETDILLAREISAITTRVCATVFAEASLFLLLDKHKLLDTLFCILIFIAYPFWFSRIAVLVPLLGSPPFQTKVAVIQLVLYLHMIRRCLLGRHNP